MLTYFELNHRNRLTRKETPQESDILVLGTNFYTKLASDGPEGVDSWTSKRSLQIFKKKFIFVPVNKDLHWSLFIIVNPGLLCHLESGEGDSIEMPFMLFIDSGRSKKYAHNATEMKKPLYDWLNFQAQRFTNELFRGKEKPFNIRSMKLCDVKGKSSH